MWICPARRVFRRTLIRCSVIRPFSTSEEPRESMPFDVLIVGGGPAGLAASIRLKQLSLEQGKELSVCLIDKGRYVWITAIVGTLQKQYYYI